MKKLVLFLCSFFLCFSFTGCSQSPDVPSPQDSTLKDDGAPAVKESPPHSENVLLSGNKEDIIAADGLVPFSDSETQYIKENGADLEGVSFALVDYYFKDEDLEMISYTREETNDPVGEYDRVKAYLHSFYGDGKETENQTRKTIIWEDLPLKDNTRYNVTLNCYPERKSLMLTLVMLI